MLNQKQFEKCMKKSSVARHWNRPVRSCADSACASYDVRRDNDKNNRIRFRHVVWNEIIVYGFI